MPISCDPVPIMVMGLDHVLQILSWSGDVSVTKGKVVLLGYSVYVVVPPLLSRPLVRFKGGL